MTECRQTSLPQSSIDIDLYIILLIYYLHLCDIILRNAYRHVGSGADERVGHRVNELTAHSEITEFNFTARAHQNVGRLHVCSSTDSM